MIRSFSFLSMISILVFICSCDTVVEQNNDVMDELREDTSTVEVIEEEILTKGYLTVLNIENGNSFVAFESEQHFEAPNWSKDGDYLIFNSLGKMFKLKLYSDGLPEEINTDFAIDCNNDHVLSPTGELLAISHHIEDGHESKIFTVPVSGGIPKLVTENGPSYLHGWSPDGNKLVYCAERNGEFDIYTIDTTGENETRLTDAKGLDDGPEYSPDGQYIYFNSDRTDTMQIWRMDADGSNQVQITNDGHGDWFAHVSPNGEKIVFLSYDVSVQGHPKNRDVELRIMNSLDYKPETLLELFGGQGTINVPSWSPDGKYIAFVRYEPILVN